MMIRENFIYFILGMVNHKLFDNATNNELEIDKFKDKILSTTNSFLTNCNEPPLFSFEVRYLDKIIQYNKHLDDGAKQLQNSSK